MILSDGSSPTRSRLVDANEVKYKAQMECELCYELVGWVLVAPHTRGWDGVQVNIYWVRGMGHWARPG